MNRPSLLPIACLVTLSVAGPATSANAQQDPRIRITELQAADRLEEALVETEDVLDADPTRARALGLPYLRGHLLERMGRIDEAMTAFAEVVTSTPSLSEHARLRIALAQERLGHPEVAAGLSATLLGNQPSDALVMPAVDLLERTLSRGGDCRLLTSLGRSGLPRTARRRIELSRSLCQLRQGSREDASQDLVALLQEDRTDLPGLLAAEQLFALQRNPSDDLVRQLGEAFHHHRRFDRADPYLRRVVSAQPTITTSEDFEAHYRLVRGEFWRGKFDLAARNYGALASRSATPEQRAQALYHRGRALELSAQWPDAIAAFRESFQAEPRGEYSGAALLSAMRLEWRLDRRDSALQLYGQLAAHPDARNELARGALFLASSEIARGDVQRRATGNSFDNRGALDEIEGWLDSALGASRRAETEVLYWRGRWYENRGQDRRAADAYARALRSDFYHPIAQHALVRLDQMPDQNPRRQLASQTLANGDLMSAWVLTGTNTLEGEEIRERLRERVALELTDVVPTQSVARASWPLWGNAKARPEDQLLALGMWNEGSSAVRRHFPLSDRRLAFTATLELQRAQKVREALLIAEILNRAVPRRVPSSAVPNVFRRTVYPFAYRFPIESSANRWGIDPKLLVALIREESRFDPKASSAAAARGLTQFVLPTATRLSQKIGLGRISAIDLQSPEVSIELGAAYLAELSALSKGLIPAMIAAYNAGEAQSMLWQRHCFTNDPAEYLSKIGFTETRNYVQRVLRGYALYRELYPTPRDARPRA